MVFCHGRRAAKTLLFMAFVLGCCFAWNTFRQDILTAWCLTPFCFQMPGPQLGFSRPSTCNWKALAPLSPRISPYFMFSQSTGWPLSMSIHVYCLSSCQVKAGGILSVLWNECLDLKGEYGREFSPRSEGTDSRGFHLPRLRSQEPVKP